MSVYTVQPQFAASQPKITTPQQDTVAYAQALGALAAQIQAVYEQALVLQSQQTVHDYVTKFNNTPTYALNADGSAGATDGSPNTANPMVGINVSANAVSAFVGYGLNDFVTWFTGSGATAQADRRSATGGLLQ